MSTNTQPDYASPPGETLRETLEELGLSTAELAVRISLPEVDVRAVADGKSPIGLDMAGRFEEALRVPRDFWIALERQYQERKRAIDEMQRRQQRFRSTCVGLVAGIAAGAILACPALAFVMSRAQAKEAKAEARITEARIEGADEGYAAAEQPTQPALAHTVGYVYLGTCEKTWATKNFVWIPPCSTTLPPDGLKIISRKGDVIRESLPSTSAGRRKFGEPIGRVSAGYTVILRSMHAVSAYPSGPQHYWGKVELLDQPAQSPKD
jgi:addiction module HigA family antidote